MFSFFWAFWCSRTSFSSLAATSLARDDVVVVDDEAVLEDVVVSASGEDEVVDDVSELLELSS